jgi:hypothetical protein
LTESNLSLYSNNKNNVFAVGEVLSPQKIIWFKNRKPANRKRIYGPQIANPQSATFEKGPKN